LHGEKLNLILHAFTIIFLVYGWDGAMLSRDKIKKNKDKIIFNNDV
jgi:hypothetical protein